MAVKIRLQRFGRKRKPYYHIVVADARAPRDGRFIERLGSYNPNTNPATIELDVDRSAQWLFNGAQPTDTCRAILSYKGVLYKHHLNTGVRKGAITQDKADEKFTLWMAEKEARINAKRNNLTLTADQLRKAKFEAEAKVNADRARKIAEKNSPVAEEVAAATEEEIPAAEEATPASEENAAE